MRTVQIVIQVTALDVRAATAALEAAGFKVRIDYDHPVDIGTTALELVISYPMAESHDIEADQQAMALRESVLTEAGIEWKHLSYGVSAGPSLSTFTVRRRADPDDGGSTVLAKDWDEFRSVWGTLHGDFDEEEFEVTVVGLAAADPRD